MSLRFGMSGSARWNPGKHPTHSTTRRPLWGPLKLAVRGSPPCSAWHPGWSTGTPFGLGDGHPHGLPRFPPDRLQWRQVVGCVGWLVRFSSSTLLLYDWPHYTLKIRDQCLSVLRDVELHCAVTIFFVAITRQEIEGVVPSRSKKDCGTDLAIHSTLSQFIGKVDELIYELEEFWWVRHR
jgi:hypothetical protein